VLKSSSSWRVSAGAPGNGAFGVIGSTDDPEVMKNKEKRMISAAI